VTGFFSLFWRVDVPIVFHSVIVGCRKKISLFFECVCKKVFFFSFERTARRDQSQQRAGKNMANFSRSIDGTVVVLAQSSE
jgi:hypothetical protein